MKYLISGGGTGGHIFPAVSIANALKELDPEAEILFIGALGRMEMERVPQAGYKIIGLPVRGFNRAQPWKNVSVLIDLAKSIRQVKKIIRDFQPNVGVGVGGYASGAAMWAAANMGIPILLQEQNGFAGVTNKILKNKATKICVAYEGMERFFPADKIILTGNPVRQNLTSGKKKAESGKTLLIIGGSLGARTINEAVLAGLPQLKAAGIHVVWQTGKTYYDKIQSSINRTSSIVQSSIKRISFLLTTVSVAGTQTFNAIKDASHIMHPLLLHYVIDILDHLARRVLVSANEERQVCYAV